MFAAILFITHKSLAFQAGKAIGGLGADVRVSGRRAGNGYAPSSMGGGRRDAGSLFGVAASTMQVRFCVAVLKANTCTLHTQGRHRPTHDLPLASALSLSSQ